MASYARKTFRVQDSDGNLILDPRVEVKVVTPGLPLASIFSDRAGTTQLPNPVTFNNGLINFCAPGGLYRIRVTSATHPGYEEIWDEVGIGNLSSLDLDGSGLFTFNWSAIVANLAGRDAYDDQAAGFSVLVESDSSQSNLPVVYYKKSAVGGPLAGAVGTAIGNMTGGGNLAAAFNGTTAQAAAASAVLADSNLDGFVGKDWGSGNSKVITQAVLYGPSDMAIARNASNVATSVSAQLQGSNDASSWTTLNTQATGTANSAVITFTSASTTPYRYHRILIPAASTSSDKTAAEVTFREKGDWSSGFVFGAIRMKAGITMKLDARGAIIATGAADDIPVAFPCELTGWRATADGVGSIVVELRKGSYASWPSGYTNITGASPVTLSSAQKAEDFALSGWSKLLEEGEMLQPYVVSCAGLTKVNLTLFVRRR